MGEFDPRLARLKILIAEDEPMNRRVLGAMCKILDGDVTMVGNGLEAVTAAEKIEFDVILMDQHMPECDGSEATRQIRAREQTFNVHVPILCTSHATTAEEREKYFAAGMDDFLDKPFRLEDVASKLLRWTTLIKAA